MARLWLTVAFPLLLLLAFCMIVIHAQPSPTDNARTFFNIVQSCSRPCFLGIEPGRTSLAEAKIMLQSSGWVDTIDDIDGQIEWTWSGYQSPWIDSAAKGKIVRYAGETDVGEIDIKTNIPIQTIWVLFGYPPKGSAGLSQQAMRHFNEYDRLQLVVTTITSCPADISAFLDTPVTLFWWSIYPTSGSFSRYDRSWRQYAQC